MPRVKRGTIANKRRKNLLKHAKGFMWTRKSHYRQAKEALLHAWTHQFNDRKKKKGNFRRLWQVQIGAATREAGLPYNQFINGLKKSNIEIDRKMLSELAQQNPDIFNKIAEMAKTATK
ncbi:MAG: 50S ribosomal protein L20 [bacterium]|nr:50S ribosomal protein L20 [bacterium]